jgi:DNA excision repair protein ERCC-4
MNDLIIVKDTREKKPWDFGFYGVEQTVKKVDTGDYTLVGYEDRITIDRKQSIAELYQNLFKQYSRFKREMERMRDMESYIVCEFPYSDVLSFPDSMPLVWCSKAKQKTSLNLRFDVGAVIDKIEKIAGTYGVQFVYCDNRRAAELTAFNILKDFYEKVEICD